MRVVRQVGCSKSGSKHKKRISNKVCDRGSRYLRLKISTLALAVQMASVGALCSTEGASVVAGAGNVNRSGDTTTINQLTDRMAINWQSYDVNASERVQYIQPSSSSVSLNRILSNRGSEIQGKIDVNEGL